MIKEKYLDYKQHLFNLKRRTKGYFLAIGRELWKNKPKIIPDIILLMIVFILLLDVMTLVGLKTELVSYSGEIIIGEDQECGYNYIVSTLKPKFSHQPYNCIINAEEDEYLVDVDWAIEKIELNEENDGFRLIDLKEYGIPYYLGIRKVFYCYTVCSNIDEEQKTKKKTCDIDKFLIEAELLKCEKEKVSREDKIMCETTPVIIDHKSRLIQVTDKFDIRFTNLEMIEETLDKDKCNGERKTYKLVYEARAREKDFKTIRAIKATYHWIITRSFFEWMISVFHEKRV